MSKSAVDSVDVWVGMLRIADRENPVRTEQLAALIGGINHNEIITVFAAAALSTRILLERHADTIGSDVTAADLIEVMQRANYAAAADEEEGEASD